ncbi:MAG: hypothetical protein QOK40_3408, partial [Miltoncostaeaceae bacterium]|nr:hypothetical protein [Miltoncostaeaceae bacterium]
MPGRDERRAQQRRRRLRRQRALLLVALLVLVAGAFTLPGAFGGQDGPARQETARPPADTAAAAPRPAATGVLRLAAVGDIVMGSPPYGLPADGGASFFAPVAHLLKGDVVLGNLEGTLATGGSSKCGSGSSNCYAFKTPPSYAQWFRRAGFTVMNLANNHAMDYGAEGQRETVAALDRVGLRHFGRPGETARLQVRGIRVALLGFAPYPWANSLTDIPAARRLVAAAARDADVVIVMIHAGAEGSGQTRVPYGAETFLGEPRGDSRAFSHAVIDAGADLVVGSGPHVMRGMEVYRGRLVAYSLGNFAGYKVFGLGGTLSTSGVLQVTLAADGRFRTG